MTGDPTGSTDGPRRAPVSAEQAATWLAVEWLARLNELSRPASHELRNALNGVSVNLEVIRSRAGRPGQAAEGLAGFAEAAVEQAELLSEFLEVVLSFIRPASEPADLAKLVRRTCLLLDSAARGRGGAVVVELDDGYSAGAGTVRDAARIAVLGVLLDAFEPDRELNCRLVAAPTPALYVQRSGTSLPAPSERLVSLVSLAGARLDWDSGRRELYLPRPVPTT